MRLILETWWYGVTDCHDDELQCHSLVMTKLASWQLNYVSVIMRRSHSTHLHITRPLTREAAGVTVLLLQWYSGLLSWCPIFNTLRPRQDGLCFADDTFKRIFLNENVRISIEISLNFVPKGPIINIPALVQIMAWRRSGGKPLSEPMMVSLLMHICVTRHQWVN